VLDPREVALRIVDIAEALEVVMKVKDELDERGVLPDGDENEMFDGEEMLLGVVGQLREIDDDLLEALDGGVDLVDKIVKLSSEVVKVEHVVLLVCVDECRVAAITARDPVGDGLQCDVEGVECEMLAVAEERIQDEVESSRVNVRECHSEGPEMLLHCSVAQ
jgi:hypothetical protein